MALIWAHREKTFQNPKYFPESKNMCQNPRIENTSQNHVFLDSGKCFGFWKVFWILESDFDFWEFLGLWEGFVPTSQ